MAHLLASTQAAKQQLPNYIKKATKPIIVLAATELP